MRGLSPMQFSRIEGFFRVFLAIMILVWERPGVFTTSHDGCLAQRVATHATKNAPKVHLMRQEFALIIDRKAMTPS